MDQGFLQNILYEVSVWALPALLAITFHEAAHGYVAWLLGDPTARQAGRVTLNPLPHIDRFGTVVLPILCLIAPIGLVFGYAKPVPVNLARLGNPRRDTILVAAAGPLANVALLAVSALLLHALVLAPEWLGPWLAANLQRSILLNAVLAVFNMLPVPPLDGGRIVTCLLPWPLARRYARLERWGILIVIGLVFLLPALADGLGYDPGPMQNMLAAPVFGLIDAMLAATGVR